MPPVTGLVRTVANWSGTTIGAVTPFRSSNLADWTQVESPEGIGWSLHPGSCRRTLGSMEFWIIEVADGPTWSAGGQLSVTSFIANRRTMPPADLALIAARAGSPVAGCGRFGA